MTADARSLPVLVIRNETAEVISKVWQLLVQARTDQATALSVSMSLVIDVFVQLDHDYPPAGEQVRKDLAQFAEILQAVASTPPGRAYEVARQVVDYARPQ